MHAPALSVHMPPAWSSRLCQWMTLSEGWMPLKTRCNYEVVARYTSDAGAGDAAAGAWRQVLQPPWAEGRRRRHRGSGAPHSSTSHSQTMLTGRLVGGANGPAACSRACSRDETVEQMCTISHRPFYSDTHRDALDWAMTHPVVSGLLCRQTCPSARRASAPTWS